MQKFIKQIANTLVLIAMASVLLATNAHANGPYVNFIEGAEGQLGTVQFNPTDWTAPFGAFTGPENAVFSGMLPGQVGTGSYLIALLEPGSSENNPIYSDFLSVEWGAINPGFDIVFSSDAEGQGLNLGGAFLNLVVMETGLL
jgi:hypothetical protein